MSSPAGFPRSPDADRTARRARRPGRKLFFEQVGDRRRALVLDIGAAAHDGALVERDAAMRWSPVVLRGCHAASYASRGRSSRIDNESACASSPSASASGSPPARARRGSRRRSRRSRCASGSRARRGPRRSARCARSAARGWGRRHSRRPPRACSGRERSRRHGGSFGQRIGLVDRQLEMLGRDAVDQRRRLVPVATTMIAPFACQLAPRDRGARQRRQMALDRGLDRGGEVGSRR